MSRETSEKRREELIKLIKEVEGEEIIKRILIYLRTLLRLD